MTAENERRREQRLRYYWPVWFAEDFNNTLSQGQMVDISSGGAGFNCNIDENCPYEGQQITTRFSIPYFGAEDSFEMSNFVRPGHVCRVEQINSFVRRIAVQFAEPLPFKPGEQAENDDQLRQKLNAVTI